MKIYHIFFIFFLSLLIVFSGCVHDEVIVPNRTILYYISGDNSLSGYAHANIASSIAGAADNNLNGGNLLIYLDTRNDVPMLLQIRRTSTGLIQMDTIKQYPEQNSASIEVMRHVLNDVFHYPRFTARSTGVVLWSHGTSWLPSDLGTGGYLNLRAFGQDGRDWMELNMLRDALEGYHFDFIIFDACYMAGIEVMYALRHNADYILASPTEVIAEGLPYHLIVKTMFADMPIP
ncbi:MAG: hypothetical protein LBD28_07150, partial [Tannerellaceae bacterium]|nr:hypothetical protein [Tannerellaceae bacterium]